MPQLINPALVYQPPPTLGDLMGGYTPHPGVPNAQYFHNDQDALAAGNAILGKQDAANPMQIDPETGQLTGGGPAGPVPNLVHPSFKQATQDQYGQTKPIGPGLTKLGKLLAIVGAATRGASDAVAGGALNAVPGQSGFGAGFEAAQQMPLIRASRRMAVDREGLQNAALQAQTAYLPMLRMAQIAHMGAQTQQAQATAEMDKARTGNLHYKAVPGVGLMQLNPDGSPLGIVPGSEVKDKENTPTSRLQFTKDHPELFQDQADADAYVKYGAQSGKQTNVSEWQTRIDAANGDPTAQAAVRSYDKTKNPPTYTPLVDPSNGKVSARFNNRTGQAEPISNPAGAGKTASAQGGGTGHLTENERVNIVARRNKNVAELNRFQPRPDGTYADVQTGRTLTAQQMQDQKQQIEDNYAKELNAAGYDTSFNRLPQGSPSSPAATAAGGAPRPSGAPAAKPAGIVKGAIASNPQTGERVQFDGSKWVTITQPKKKASLPALSAGR